MALKYTDEKLKEMATEFLEARKERRNMIGANMLINALSSHFSLDREQTLAKIQEYADMEFD